MVRKAAFNRTEKLFNDALALPPSQRHHFLNTACADDPDLLKELELLLACDQMASDAFEEIVLVIGQDDPSTHPSLPEPFTIERPLGVGGMGEVYLARQSPPDRQVAIKVLKSLWHNPGQRRRFETEFGLMARLNHVAIAQVFQVGVHERQPYIAMEFVNGPSINEYTRQLPLECKLDLFRQVCRAIHYAHQRGVIHRDIKPSNVLVDRISGLPKVIDFGIAKSFGESHTARSLTSRGVPIGTPGYISPEQLTHECEIDTRTDVYSLGVLLFELITETPLFEVTGESPLQWIKLMHSAVHLDPPRPSTRLVKSGQKALANAVKGDLDWIVAKATARKPSARYESVRELERDIQNFVEQRPLAARAPSAGYLFKKFMVRHKWRVSVLAAGLAAGIIALAAILVGFLNAQELQRVAQEERQRTERVMAYFTDQLAQSTPDRKGMDLTVAELFNDMEKGLEHDFKDNADLQNRIHLALADFYFAASDYERARLHAQKASAHFADLVSPAAASALFQYGRAECVFNLKQGVEILYQAVDRHLLLYGDDHAKTLLCRAELALRLCYLEPDHALAEIDRVIATFSKHRDREGEVESQLQRARILASIGQIGAANGTFRDFLPEAQALFGELHMRVIRASHDYARSLQIEGQFNEAERLFVHSGPTLEARFGSDHLFTLMNREAWLGNHLRMKILSMPIDLTWRQMEADLESLIRRYELLFPVFSVDHLKEDLAVIATSMGQSEKALRLLNQVRSNIDPQEANYAERDGWTLGLIADNEAVNGDLETARRMYQVALAGWRIDNTDFSRLFVNLRYAIVLRRLGQNQEADQWVAKNYPLFCQLTLPQGIFRMMINQELEAVGFAIETQRARLAL